MKWLASASMPLAVFLAALGLRLYHLGEESLWIDEAITYGRATLAVPALIEDTLARKHVPTYFLFMHGWVHLGDSEAFLRLPSALLGALTAMLIALAARRLRGAMAGLTAGLLVALASAQVYYGQEARMYTLLTCEAACALYCACVLFVAERRVLAWPALDEQQRLTNRAYAGICLSSLALLYTHNTGMFCVAGVLGLLLALVLSSRGQRMAVLRSVVLCQLPALLLWLPFLPTLLRQAGTFDKWRNRPLSLEHAKVMAQQLFAYDGAVSFAAAGLSLLLLAHLLRDSDPMGSECQATQGGGVRRSAYLGLLGAVVVGVSVTALASVLKANMFFLRTLLWCALPVYLLLGCAVARLPGRALPALAAALLLGSQVPALAAHYRSEHKPPYRAFLQRLIAETDEDTPVLSVRGTRFTGYYFGREHEPLGTRVVREWEPAQSFADNLPAGADHFAVVMWRGSGRARAFLKAVSASAYRPKRVWVRDSVFVAIYERR